MKTRADTQVKRSPRIGGRGAKGKIGIPYAVGFGFGFASTPTVEPDGARLIHYRYLPPAAWRRTTPEIIGALNSAAAFGCRDEDIPLYAIRADAEPVETLTEAGQALFDRLPLYGILRAQEPYLEWTQLLPDGNEAHTARSPHVDVVIGEAQKMWPMNHWAKKFLEPWEHRLSPHAELGRVAMLMMKPMEGDIPVSKRPNQQAEPGWSGEAIDFPRAAHTERVEYPWGLWKVLLVSCPPEKTSQYRWEPLDPGHEFIEGAVGHLEEGADSFTWTPHFFHRWEMPVTMMPPILLWAEEDGNHHEADWSALDIVGCYDWDTPRLTIRQREDRTGWDRTLVLFKPLSHYDMAHLATVEAGAREHVPS